MLRSFVAPSCRHAAAAERCRRRLFVARCCRHSPAALDATIYDMPLFVEMPETPRHAPVLILSRCARMLPSAMLPPALIDDMPYSFALMPPIELLYHRSSFLRAMHARL